eukprot:TRINITY_DN20912_c0_g2_i2.p1 TRINITY_DN20912_c0_g2~~TRINITY_DN20912_c0_g2_i2.p1  ORF type:complete len:449 (-),score=75.75 TRINITY_DN20912_c0_g2_i2:209-1555(-)
MCIRDRPEGYDPKLLSKAPKRIDIGAALADPFARFIPRSITPNQITVANQVLAWVVFGCAFTYSCTDPDLSLRQPECSGPMQPLWFSNWASSPYARALLIIAVGVGNMVNMIMDCLDGIHARRTNQCSKFGEVLDHWFDAMTTPLMASISVMVLQPHILLQITLMISITMVYNAQLIFFHYERVFLHTVGVEGQVFMSVLFVVYAGFSLFPELSPYVSTFSNLIAFATTLGSFHAVWFYAVRYKERGMIIEHLMYVAVCSTVGGLYYTGFCTQLSFLMIITAISFRICGSYVIYSVINWVYRGFEPRLLEYVALMVLMHHVMAPLPLELFYQNLVPYLGGCPYTLQDLLPTVVCIDLILRNMFDIQASTKALREKDLADKNISAHFAHMYVPADISVDQFNQSFKEALARTSPSCSPQEVGKGSPGSPGSSLSDNPFTIGPARRQKHE